MDKKSSSMLPYRHIGSAVTEIKNYIKCRKEGSIKSLKTKWDKLNKVTTGGIEPNMLLTIAGCPGSGKSAFVNLLESDLITLNPNEEVVILSFNFEMTAAKQVGRKISKLLQKTVSELYSGNPETPLTDESISKIDKVSNSISNLNIYYVDTPGNVSRIEETIKYFQDTIAKDKWLIVTLDHLLLVKSSNTSERETIMDLQRVFIAAKKIGKTSIIQLSQLNRGIETSERINNPSSHYPQRQDLFGSDAIFQSSDIVIVIHRPELLQIQAYGVNALATKDMVFLHVLKNREGELCILKFRNMLKYNDLEDCN